MLRSGHLKNFEKIFFGWDIFWGVIHWYRIDFFYRIIADAVVFDAEVEYCIQNLSNLVYRRRLFALFKIGQKVLDILHGSHRAGQTALSGSQRIGERFHSKAEWDLRGRGGLREAMGICLAVTAWWLLYSF